MQTGDVVCSISGRDVGRYYAVIATVGDTFVLVADGKVRGIKNPKRKNVKHLRQTGDRLERIAEKMQTGVQVFDSELFSALRLYDKNKA